MSTWCCKDCGLINYDKSSKCIACFSYNYKKFWQCPQCDLLNPIQSMKCPACFHIKRQIEISDEWNRYHLDLRELLEDTFGGPIFKLISWNNKLYTMLITRTQNKEMIMELLDHDPKAASQPESECQLELDSNESSIHLAQDHIFSESESFSICREKGELYFTCLAGDYNDKKGECYLFIYDLNQQEIKHKYQLLFVDEKLNFHEYHAFKMQIIPNNENNENVLSKQISFYIVNYWLRTAPEFAEISLPNDVYTLINRFYSLYLQNNSLQMILYKEERKQLDVRTKHHSFVLYHGIIDLDAAYKKDDDADYSINVKILNKQILKECESKTGDRDLDSCQEKALFQYKLSIRIKYDVYVIFRDKTLIINLQSGSMNKTEPLAPPDPESYNANIDTRYDSCNDWNERYLYFISDFDNLLCFDRIRKQYINIVESGDFYDRTYDNPVCPVGWGEQELLVCGDKLVIAVCIAEIDGVRFVSETNLNIPSY